jgi:Flp pilus assembly protein TadG
MTESTPPFAMLTIVLFVIVLLIFAMKYAAQGFRARSEAARATDTDARLAALGEKTRDLESRLSRVETMLKEVE